MLHRKARATVCNDLFEIHKYNFNVRSKTIMLLILYGKRNMTDTGKV